MQTVAPLPSVSRLRERARPLSPALASSVMCKCRKRFLDRHIDDGGRVFHQCCVHAGTGRRDAADESGLFADRADRCFRQIVHLSSQQARDAAGVQQREVRRRIVGLRSGLAEWRDQHNRRSRVVLPKCISVMAVRAEIGWASFADDQVGIGECIVAGCDGLAVIEAQDASSVELSGAMQVIVAPTSASSRPQTAAAKPLPI